MESYNAIDSARNYVIENLKVLKKAYESDYIAVRNGVVLGHNDNRSKLAKDMYLKFEDVDILIGTLDDIVDLREVELSSPEVER